MKTKTLLLFGLMSLTLTVTACDKEDASISKYHLTIDSKTTDLCVGLPKEGDYKENTKFSFKIKIVTDVSFYAYLNNEKLTPTKDDMSLNGYKYYEFTMPASDVTLGIGDEIYVDREYSMNELHIFSVSKDMVTAVEIEDGGVNPPFAYTPAVQYSTDTRDIEYNCSIFWLKQLVKTDLCVSDGWYKKVTFYFSNGEKTSYRYENDLFIYRSFSNRQSFTFKEGASKPKIDYPTIPVEE